LLSVLASLIADWIAAIVIVNEAVVKWKEWGKAAWRVKRTGLYAAA
jgi:hypothetical protein